MNHFWKPCRVTYCLIRQARLGDQSFWRESKKLLSLAAIEKAGPLADHGMIKAVALKILINFSPPACLYLRNL
jgi:hypothetical protein